MPPCYRPRLLPEQGITVPCGKCGACLQNRAEDWITRLTIEQENSSSAYFVTLTYDDEHLPKDKNGNPCFSSGDLKTFHKKLRVYLKRGEFLFDTPVFGRSRFSLTNRPFKYFICSEYGPGEGHRPHYHGIYFDLPDDIYTTELLIRKAWIYGSVVTVEGLTSGRMRYTAEYALNARLASFAPSDWMPHIFRVSNGVGKAFMRCSGVVSWMRENPAKRVYLPTPGGGKRRLSRYLKNEVFDDDMKARIADEYSSHHQQMTIDELLAFEQRGKEFERQLIKRIRIKKLHYE